MDNTLSFTQRAMQEMERYLDKQAALAAQKVGKLKTAEDLKKFLTDHTQVMSPGFVLRRQIRANIKNKLFMDNSPDRIACMLWTEVEFPDLEEKGNVPWADKVTDRVAVQLSKASYQEGLLIEPRNWKGYLTDSKKITRDMCFKLAIVTRMSRERTQDLLCSCGESPYYNLRSSSELVYYYCQAVPGEYTWREIETILSKNAAYAKRAQGKKRPGKAPSTAHTVNTTKFIQQSVDDILDNAESKAKRDAKLKRFLAKNGNKLDGYPRTPRESLLRLLDYLHALYLPKKCKLKYKELIEAMFKQIDWYVADIFQNSGAGGRYIFRGEEADAFGPQFEEHSFCGDEQPLGEIALFCKYLYNKSNNIKNGDAPVGRQIVLVLIYFLIVGYVSAGGEQRKALWQAIDGSQPMDVRLAGLQGALEDLAKKPEAVQRKNLCERVINELLAGFGLRSLHPLMVYDRFVLLTLLSEDPTWTARFLTADELSILEVNDEGENAPLPAPGRDHPDAGRGAV